MLEQTIWLSNHTSHTKVYFNEFVANVLRDDIGIVVFDLRGHGGCCRPKTSLGGQKKPERVDLSKKYIPNKTFSTTSLLCGLTIDSIVQNFGFFSRGTN